MVLPAEGAVATLEEEAAAVLAVVMVDGFAVAVVALDVVDAGRFVMGAVAGLEAEKGGHDRVVNKH